MTLGRVAQPRALVAQSGVAAVVASLSLLSPTATASVPADIALPGPATVMTLGLATGETDDDLQGLLCRSPNTCGAVKYNRFYYPSGAAPLDRSIRETEGMKIVYGYSQGGQVISAWMKEYADDVDAPDPDELMFVIIGNGDRRYGGSNAVSGFATPDTQYRVIDVARQYDFAADLPDNRLNLLAMANAWAGFFLIHIDYEDVDLYDPANYVWTEGNTTYVFVPTENIPLLEPLRWVGLGKLADSMNGPLKEIIERGYNRDYLPPRPPVEPADPVATPDDDLGDEDTDSSGSGALDEGADGESAAPAAPLPEEQAPGTETGPLAGDDVSTPPGALTGGEVAQPVTSTGPEGAQEFPGGTDDGTSVLESGLAELELIGDGDRLTGAEELSGRLDDAEADDLSGETAELDAGDPGSDPDDQESRSPGTTPDAGSGGPDVGDEGDEAADAGSDSGSEGDD